MPLDFLGGKIMISIIESKTTRYIIWRKIIALQCFLRCSFERIKHCRTYYYTVVGGRSVPAMGTTDLRIYLLLFTFVYLCIDWKSLGIPNILGTYIVVKNLNKGTTLSVNLSRDIG